MQPQNQVAKLQQTDACVEMYCLTGLGSPEQGKLNLWMLHPLESVTSPERALQSTAHSPITCTSQKAVEGHCQGAQEEGNPSSEQGRAEKGLIREQNKDSPSNPSLGGVEGCDTQWGKAGDTTTATGDVDMRDKTRGRSGAASHPSRLTD